MKPGECRRNLWWRLLDECRERGRVEHYEVRGLDHGPRVAVLVGSAVAIIGAALALWYVLVSL